MKTLAQKLKHIGIAAGVAGGVAFLQTLSIDGGAQFGQETWWPLAAAGLTLVVAELEALEKVQ